MASQSQRNQQQQLSLAVKHTVPSSSASTHGVTDISALRVLLTARSITTSSVCDRNHRSYAYGVNNIRPQIISLGSKERDGEDEKNNDKYYHDITDDDDEANDEALNRKHNNSLHSANVQYGYTLCSRSQGFITISKTLTEHIIPKNIKEPIENVYDFMDKITGIALLRGLILNVNNAKIINYGFHCKLYGEVLYVVADKQIKGKIPYNMRNILYTNKQICDIFRVKEHDLPPSLVDCYKDKIANDIHTLRDIFADYALYEIENTKWNKLPVFHGIKNKKEYNKRRITFSITKPEFLSALQTSISVYDETSNLIPIIMFTGDGYRVEYIHIIKIEKEKSNIDIGISYTFDADNKRLEATGIHLNKESILRQHQLIAPNHDCHCLDDFQCHVDDLHIGNPDDDKNRVKDLKSKNLSLKQKICEQNQVNDLKQENLRLKKTIKKLTLENVKLMRRSISFTQSCPLPALSPIVLSSPYAYSMTRAMSNGSPFSDTYFTPSSSSSTTSTTFSQFFQ